MMETTKIDMMETTKIDGDFSAPVTVDEQIARIIEQAPGAGAAADRRWRPAARHDQAGGRGGTARRDVRPPGI